MGDLASAALLADTASTLQNFVRTFVLIYIVLILVHILLSSWIRLPYSQTSARVQEFLSHVCSPYLNLFRGRIPTLGPFDVSPIVAIAVLSVAAGFVNYLIGALL